MSYYGPGIQVDAEDAGDREHHPETPAVVIVDVAQDISLPAVRDANDLHPMPNHEHVRRGVLSRVEPWGEEPRWNRNARHGR